MNKTFIKIVSIFLIIFTLSSPVLAAVATNEQTSEEVSDSQVNEGTTENESEGDKIPAVEPSITISSQHLSVTVNRRITLTAIVSGTTEIPEITWTSSDEKVATVNQKGQVKGVKAGKTIITATGYIDGKMYSAQYAIKVVTSTNIVKDLLEKQQILSYQYSYEDDYYYTNDKDAWQYNFGYGKLYDIAAPFVLLEYDYIRVFFEYEGKDWMIQLWKGQYGLIFYGSEIGVYNKPHSDEEDNLFTFYSCPAKEDWLKMGMTLYHQQLNGEYIREFTREYDDYWWCTGFKDGHLRVEEPADELRMDSAITLKDEEMTKLFTDGLIECGFKQATDKDNLQTDEFYVEGNTVTLKWQNINEAENTMPIKVGAGFVIATNIITAVLSVLSFFSLLGLGALFFI